MVVFCSVTPEISFVFQLVLNFTSSAPEVWQPIEPYGKKIEIWPTDRGQSKHSPQQI